MTATRRRCFLVYLHIWKFRWSRKINSKLILVIPGNKEGLCHFSFYISAFELFKLVQHYNHNIFNESIITLFN